MNLERLRDRFFEGVSRYQWLETVGRGGMGVIFKAQDLELDDVVAIKVLSPDLESDDQELLARFKREIQLNRKIKHPNVARLHDFGTSADYPYITMEFIPGIDLRRLVQREGKLPAERAINILRQISLGTEAAHKLGIIHRDLKSQNVMIEDSGAIAILDFGLARGKVVKEHITIDSIMIGTPHYMPPEQALGKSTDARSDIYSIGVMAFELLTGRVPFTGDSPLVIAMKQVSEPVPEGLLTVSSVQPDLAAVVLRALQKKPEDRFPSASALEAELAMIQVGEKPAAETISGPISGPVLGPAVEPPTVPVPAARPAAPKAPVPARTAPPPPPPVPGVPAGGRAQPLGRTVESPSGTMHPLKERAPYVLIVEDDFRERKELADLLSRAGCKTLEARSGQKALETLLKEPVDLVLMDVKLPDMDGFDVTRIIKSQRGAKKLPIILMSSRLDRGLFAFGIQSGATDMVSKPLAPESTAPAIWGILQRRGFLPPPDMQLATAKLEESGSTTRPV